MQNETKNQALDFRRSNTFLNPKRNELATLKQHFFLRILQTFDTRLPNPRAVLIC